MNQIELKEKYNTTLERIKKAEKYYKTHKIDRHYNSFKALIHTQNALLDHITSATAEEILNGFTLGNENDGVETDAEINSGERDEGKF